MISNHSAPSNSQVASLTVAAVTETPAPQDTDAKLNKHAETSYISFKIPSSIHYFGNGSIFGHNGTETRFDKVATDIMILCDGTRNMREIADDIMNQYGWDDDREIIYDKIETFIWTQLKIGNLERLDIPNKRKMSTTGIRGKQYPNRIVLEITNGCNLQCGHCFMESQKNGCMIPLEIIDVLLKYEGLVHEIQITGGEPLIHPDFQKIVERLNNKFTLILMSNGTLIPKYNPKLFNCFSFVQITVYGYDHESFLHVTGSDKLDDLLRGIEVLSKNGVNLQIAIMLNKMNMGHLEDFVNVVTKHGASNIKIGTASPLGRATENMNEWIMTEEDLAIIGQKITELHDRYKNIANIYEWTDDYSDLKNGESIFDMPHCGAGFTHVCIDPKLRIRACQFLPSEKFILKTDLESLADGHHEKIDDRLDELVDEIEAQGFNPANICALLEKIAAKDKQLRSKL